jgi:hypothetical protein
LSEEKKLSIAALTQTLPARLRLHVPVLRHQPLERLARVLARRTLLIRDGLYSRL